MKSTPVVTSKELVLATHPPLQVDLPLVATAPGTAAGPPTGGNPPRPHRANRRRCDGAAARPGSQWVTSSALASAPPLSTWRRTASRPQRCDSQRKRRRSEEHTSELQSPCNLVCRLLLEKKKHAPSVRRWAFCTGHR